MHETTKRERAMPRAAVSALIAWAIAWGAPAHACAPQGQPAAAAPGNQDPAGSAAQRFQELKAAYDKAMAEFESLYGEAKTDAERETLFRTRLPKGTDYAPRAIAIAKAAPNDPVALDALLWSLDLGMGPEPDEVLALLAKDHVASDRLGPFCQTIGSGFRPAIAEFLRAVVQKNPHHDVQGCATYGLASWHSRRAEYANRLRGADAEENKGLEQFLGAAGVAELRALDVAATEHEAETLYEQVVARFGDVKRGRGTLGDAAKGDLFELRNLAVGKVAPDIEGEDVLGVKFKLSDYRGKVIFLDFWGFW